VKVASSAERRLDFQTAKVVIARSEATKQSILPLRGEMDCFASLAMTAAPNTTPRSRGAISPEFCEFVRLSDNRGRRECRALDAPAASRANEKSTRA
jgi:hypothetical protein